MQRRMSNRERIERLRAEADAAAKERESRARSPAKARSTSKQAAPAPRRVRFAWSVCGPNGKEVIRFAYAQEDEARAEATRRTESTGQTHFVTKAEVPVD